MEAHGIVSLLSPLFYGLLPSLGNRCSDIFCSSVSLETRTLPEACLLKSTGGFPLTLQCYKAGFKALILAPA